MPKENVYGFTEDNKRVKIGEIGKIVTFPSNTSYMKVSSNISDCITFKINGGSSISSADFIQNYRGQSVTGIDTIEIISNNYDLALYWYSSDVPITYSGLGWDFPSAGYNKEPFGPTTANSVNRRPFSYINIAINQSTSFSEFIVEKNVEPI